jgi:hypothetical protein
VGSKVPSLEHNECIYYRTYQPTHTLKERTKERKNEGREREKEIAKGKRLPSSNF